MRTPGSFDTALLVSTLILVTFGVVMLYSATGGSTVFYKAQLVWAAIGVAVMVLAWFVPIRVYENFSYLVYSLVILLLIAVLAVGVGKSGEHRWFELGFLRFQPSEPAKLGVILALSAYLCSRKRRASDLSSVVMPVLIVGVPAALILKEPDLGTSVLLSLVLFPMLFWAGYETKYSVFLVLPMVSILTSFHWVVWAVFIVLTSVYLYNARALLRDKLVVLGLCLLMGQFSPVVWRALKPYQKERILSFVKPQMDPLGAGYQIFQSKIALGSGGLLGKGYMMGTQKGLEFLPEKHTDFIFSVVGEELGFLGCLLVLALFSFVFLRCLRVACQTRSSFASLVSIGVSSLMASQVIINVSVSAGLVPVTGMTLPFLSYGGSSLVTNMAAIGILIGFYMRKGEY